MKKLTLLLCTFVLVLSVHAQWSDNSFENLKLTNTSSILGSEMKVASDGSYYFFYEKGKGGNIAKYLQRYDSKGVKVWAEDLEVSDYSTMTYTMVNQRLLVDKEGNAIVIVSDIRHDVTNRGISFTAYKVSPEGKQMWSDTGVNLAPGKTFKISAALQATQLLDGSFVFAWMNAGANPTPPDANAGNVKTGQVFSFIEMQRVSADGETLWTNKFISEEGVDITYPYVVDAGNNEFFVAYARGASQELYVKKLDFEGSSSWPTDTKVYQGGGFSTAPLHANLNAAPADGGILLGWNDDRDSDDQEDAYGAYVKNDGTHGFSDGEGGTQLGYADLRKFSPSLVFDKANSCIYAAWRETSSGGGFSRITTQKISMEGELKWAGSGVEVAELLQRPAAYYSIQLGDKGTVATFFMTQEGSYGHTLAHAVLQNNDGSFVWADTNVVMSSMKSEKGGLLTTSFANNQWVGCWVDSREEGKDNIYAQNITMEGKLGESEGASNESSMITPKNDMQVSISPNPAVGTTNIEINSTLVNNTNVIIDIIDISGRLIKNIYKGFISNGNNTIQYNVDGLTPGMYFIKIATPTSLYSSKLIVK